MSSGGERDLEKYRRLGISEVWFWKEEEIIVHILLETKDYTRVKRSSCLANLDMELLQEYVVRAFKGNIRQSKREWLKKV